MKTDAEYTVQLIENKDLSQEDLIEQLKLSCSLLLQENEHNKMQGCFMAMASHEFRSPLTNIQLSASLMERYYDKMDDQKKMFHINAIKNAVNDLTSILNDFLSADGLMNNNLKPTFAAFDLVEFCEGIANEMGWGQANHQTITYQHKSQDRLVSSDRNFLRHCIINLISNAIKYSADDGMIEFETEIADGDFIIKIKDYGIGIPPESQNHVFEAFFRADNTTDIQGTGLGLNIVEHYVQLLKGKVKLVSRVNSGTTFLLIFPVEPLTC
jgi:signal transduction histidine kinase